MEHPTQFWLTDARYLEGKGAVAIQFSQLNTRRMARLPFFPSFYLSKRAANLELLKNLFSGEQKRFRIEQREHAFKVTASTFSGLNQLANALFNETGFRPIVLRPERQFLLERDWSYFDCFTLLSENHFEKSSSFSIPETKLDFFSETIDETLQQLVEDNQPLAEKIFESIILSNLLRLPLSNLPHNDFSLLEAMFENIFRETGLGIGKSRENSVSCPENTERFGVASKCAEVDFSMLWPTLLTKPIYNLGPDSIDCQCCKPLHLAEKNVLPNSLVVVEILQDGFFFESCSSSFAKDFHKMNECKESRLRRMQEFCLSTIPAGPFFRFQKAAVPLIDAVKLQRLQKARILSVKEMHWFCLRRESLVSKAILQLNEGISLLERKCDEMRLEAVKEHGVLSTALLSANLNYLLLQNRIKAMERLLCSMPLHLCNEKSIFFWKDVCSAIEAIEADVLNSFRRFAAKKESRVVLLGRNKAYLNSDKPYALIKQFSEKRRVPALIRAKSR